MEFVTLDFETANYSLNSICSVGIAEFKNGKVSNTWESLINPEDWFSPINIGVHGITEEMVENEKTFTEIYPKIRELLENKVVVHHTAYDKSAFIQTCEKYGLEVFNIKWLDSAKVVRRTWNQFKDRGYGLAPMCEFLDIKFKHHDALEDAIAAGKILVEASKIRNLDELEWLECISQPIIERVRDYKVYKEGIEREGNPDGDLYGEVLVFTGSLFLPKKDLSPIAANMGCKVEKSFTNRTTILVVGTQSQGVLKEGETKSSSHIKAEKRIAEGGDVRILSEDDFMKIFLMSNKEINLDIPKTKVVRSVHIIPTTAKNTSSESNNTLDFNKYGEMNQFIDAIYRDVKKSDKNYLELGAIRDEDDELIRELHEELENGNIVDEADLKDWFKSIKQYKVYTNKYLRDRASALAMKYNIFGAL